MKTVTRVQNGGKEINKFSRTAGPLSGASHPAGGLHLVSDGRVPRAVQVRFDTLEVLPAA